MVRCIKYTFVKVMYAASKIKGAKWIHNTFCAFLELWDSQNEFKLNKNAKLLSILSRFTYLGTGIVFNVAVRVSLCDCKYVWVSTFLHVKHMDL